MQGRDASRRKRDEHFLRHPSRYKGIQPEKRYAPDKSTYIGTQQVYTCVCSRMYSRLMLFLFPTPLRRVGGSRSFLFIWIEDFLFWEETSYNC